MLLPGTFRNHGPDFFVFFPPALLLCVIPAFCSTVHACAWVSTDPVLVPLDAFCKGFSSANNSSPGKTKKKSGNTYCRMCRKKLLTPTCQVDKENTFFPCVIILFETAAGNVCVCVCKYAELLLFSDVVIYLCNRTIET